MPLKYLTPPEHSELTKLREVCCGNKAAESFCFHSLMFVNILDDLFDRDEPVTADVLAGSLVGFISNFAFNEFFVAHKESLYPLIVQAISAWADSETMKKSEDPQIQDASDILKAFFSEVIFHVAFLCGGYEHMRMCSKKYRTFDFERQITPQ